MKVVSWTRLAVAVLLPVAGAAWPTAAAADVGSALAVQLDGPDRSVPAGRASQVVAHVVDAASGLPVVGVTVVLTSHPTSDAASSTAEGAGVTDSAGAVAFQVSPVGATTYTATSSTATSNDTVLSPRQAAVAGPVDAPSLSAGNGSLTVSWAPPYDDGSGVSRYDVRAVPASVGGLPAASTLETSTTGTTVTFTGAQNDDPYTVSVTPVTGSLTPDPYRPHDYTVGVVTPTSDPAAPPNSSSGTDVCGTLPDAITTWSASGAPYRICASGVFVPLGRRLVLDGTAGGFQITGRHDLVVRGQVATRGTSQSSLVQLVGVGLHLGDVRSNLARPDDQDHDPATAQLSWVQTWSGSLTGYGTFLVGDDLLAVGRDAHDGDQPGIGFYGGAVDLTGVQAVKSGGRGLELTATRRARLVHARVSGATSYGLSLCGGTVEESDVAISGSNLGAPGRLPGPAASLCSPNLVTGAGSAADTLTGSGNGIDAVLLDGTLAGDLTWQPSVDSAASHALGYLNGGLTVGAGTTLTVPGSTTFASGPSSLHVDGRLDLQQGSVLTSAADPRTALPCPSQLTSTCLPANGSYQPECVTGQCTELTGTWGGIDVRAGTVTGSGTLIDHAGHGILLGTGSVTLQSSLVLHAFQAGIATSSPSSDAGRLTLRGTSIRWVAEGPGVQVRAHDLLVDSSVIADTDGPGLAVIAGTGSTQITNDVIHDTGGPGLTVSTNGHLALSGDLVRRARGVAAVVTGSGYTYGTGRDVQPLRGGGNELDAIVLEGTDSTDVPYGTPQQQDTDHDLTPTRPADVPPNGTDTVPGVVVNQTLTRDRALGISWTPVTNPWGGAVPISGYQLAVTGQPVRQLPASATGYLLGGLTNGTTYTVHVRAVTSTTRGPWSSPARFGVPAPPPDPAVFRSVTFTPGLRVLDVAWRIGPTAFVSVAITGSQTSGGPTYNQSARGAHFFRLRQDATYTITLQPYDTYGTPGKPSRYTLRGTSLTATSATVRRGQAASLLVRLRDRATGQALGRQRLTVLARRSGTTGWTRLAPVTTAADGTVRVSVRPSATTAYLFSWVGMTSRLAANCVGSVTVR